MRMVARLLVLMGAAVVACGNPPPYMGPDDDSGDNASQAPLVVTERGTMGGVLVFVAENGERVSDLTKPGTVQLSDGHPAWSPDGEWIVFASTRGREDLLRTSLWVVRAEAGSVPHRITFSTGDSVDTAPAWTADGNAIVFSSNRADPRGMDLWRLDLDSRDGGFPAGAGMPVQLTDTPAVLELSASAGINGRIVYMRTDEVGTQLWTLGVDGADPQKLTNGPADLAPAWSPDGRLVAFSAPPAGRRDTDLYVIDTDGGNRRRLVDEPVAEETGPEWSADGNYIFATALYRAEKDGKPVLSSLVVVDLREASPVVRALHDPISVQNRISVAVAPRALQAATLRKNPVYSEAIEAVVRDEFLRRANAGEIDESGHDL